MSRPEHRFDPVGALDLLELEARVLAEWADEDVFGQSLRNRHGHPEWVFYEGPPTANGRPGIHHVWARLFKDLYPRFHTMRGKHVVRKGGWDCHGLPVEVQVEKELGFSVKHEIEDYGIERFNAKCRSSVQRYVEDWQSLTSRIGMWLDTAGAYWTLSNEFIESVWWLFRQMWDRDCDLRGQQGRALLRPVRHRAVEPRARPARRVPRRHRAVGVRALPARRPRRRPARVDDDAVDAPVERGRRGRAADRLRARARARGRTRRRDGARPRRGGVRRRRERSSATSRRRELVGAHYDPPFRLVPVDGDDSRSEEPLGLRPFRVVADDFVTIDDGSGIVHLAPAFGEIDREVGEREGLPTVNPVDDAARFTSVVGAPYAGKFVKDADPELVDALGDAGKLVRVVDYTHSYPHCWRCDTPLIYWAKPTWFARTSAIQRRAAARERDDQLAPRAHQARALRRLARQQRRLGALPRPLLGHADPGVALRRLRPRHVHRLGRRAVGAVRPRPQRHGPAPPVRRRRDDPVPGVRQGHRDPHRAGARRVVRLGLDAGRAVPLPVREQPRRSARASPPTSSARRSTRRAAGSTRCSRSTRSCSTARRTATSCASRTSSTATARRCRSRAATSSTRGRCCAPAAPRRCAGTCSRRARRGRRSASTRKASTRRRASSC